MTIYVEQSLIQNFVIDFLLLKLSLAVFKLPCKNYKLILASLFGSVISLFAPLISGFLSVLLKLVLSVFMVIITTPKLPFKKIILVYFGFLGFTFMFGGASYAVFNQLKSHKNIPFFVILAVCISLFYILLKLIKKIYDRKNMARFEYSVTLFSNNRKITLNAFLDSGNKLKDCFGPVILIDTLTFLKLYPNENLSNILLKKINELSMPNTHILNISNINNSNSHLVAFTIDKLQIENFKEINNVCCAISLKKFNLDFNTPCLLNPLLF